MAGIIGRKIGMTSLYDEEGKYIACTIVEAGPCVVTQIKSKEIDQYEALQIAFDDKKEKNTTKPLIGHFKKANTTPKRIVREFDFDIKSYKLGDVIDATLFESGNTVSVVGKSKGKGFQGVVKRHGFAGVGGRTHGQHNRGRHPGSIGACSFPGRTFKGIRMGGRMGGDRVKVKNLKVIQVDASQNMLIISGSIPGANGGYILIYK